MILEIEHGITEPWGAAFYTVLEQVAGDVTTAEALHRRDQGSSSIELETRPACLSYPHPPAVLLPGRSSTAS